MMSLDAQKALKSLGMVACTWNIVRRDSKTGGHLKLIGQPASLNHKVQWETLLQKMKMNVIKKRNLNSASRVPYKTTDTYATTYNISTHEYLHKEIKS